MALNILFDSHMFDPAAYTTISSILPRLIGFIYFWAIGAFIFQIKGLIGRNGILPVSDLLDSLKTHHPHYCYFYVPSLFWLNSSDRALMGLALLGTLLSLCLMCGLYPSLLLLLLYLIYLSIVSVGQDFLSFGWEGFLLEATFYAFFVSLTPIPNLMAWICINILLFRFHVQAGAVKIQSRDKAWRNLTALASHYQTQPIPNTIAWYIHKFPLWFHKASTSLMFVIELFIPFGLFLTDDIRFGVFIAFFGLQYTIWLTGNFAFLNYLTAFLSTILLSNSILAPLISPSAPPSPPPLFMEILLSGLGSLFTFLQVIQIWQHFFPNRRLMRWLYWFAPFHLINPYGIFAIMTTKRFEIIVEGSDDGCTWKEYLFYHKPSEITRRPRRIAPYQPRLDWQVWFLPFSEFESENWFQRFFFHLLKGTPEVLKLLRCNPFSNKPPKYIRAMIYDYRFSDFKEKKENGWWWQRTLIGPYSPVVSLKNSI